MKSLAISWLSGLLAAMTLTPGVWAAEVYRWVDEQGNVHYSDTRPEHADAQKIVTQEHVVTPPDEGEQRRRALLEQADIEAKRLLEEREAQRAARERDAANLARSQALCTDARTRMAILDEQRPVYYDDNGNLRALWRFDTYAGERTYLTDQQRAVLRQQTENLIRERCQDPADPAAQSRARLQWIWSERCAVARAELDTMTQERSRTPKSDIEKQMEIVEFWCDD